ncbi:MAG: hypothetical protein JF588_13415 [Caulobacterales bacterium]|nr:hypothetical protein [Caulobacterales bacterium]
MRATTGLLTLGVLLSLGGVAHAGTAADAQRLAAAVLAPRSAMEVAPHSTIPLKAAEADTVRIPGVARTAIDRKLDDGATGSLGFLCGLQPGADKYGAAAAHGYDPTGRFVGAKLSFAFR